jgi:hypothetical protein
MKSPNTTPTNYFLALLLLFLSINAWSQEVKFTVDAPSSVVQGEQFQITYTTNVSGEIKNPDFKNFQFLGGPSTSSSTSMQIINGRTLSSTSISYTYYLSANQLGSFKTPIASLTYKGKVYKTTAGSIEVLKGANTAQNNKQSSATQETNDESFNPDGLVFVRSILSKKQVYVGEPVLLTQKLYSKENITNITDFKEPSYTGFWKEVIDIGELKLSREVVNGQSYNVVILQKAMIFPQKSGKLSIGSFDLSAVIQIIKKRKARDRFEQMMYGNIVQYYDNQNVKVNSPVIQLNVKDLPNNKPSGFSGVVGHFNIKAEVDKKEVKANDAINLKITVSGEGNIELLEAPNLVFPPDFEVYDPKLTKQISKTSEGISGKKNYDYLIIPRQEGEFIIPSYSFSYFNPHTEHYENCSSPAFTIKVLKGDGAQVATNLPAGANRDEIKYIGKDIRYLMLELGKLEQIDTHYFNSIGHLLSLILSPFFAIGLIFLIKKQQQRRGNRSLMRLKKANAVANKRLKMAQKYLKSNEEAPFYEELSKALWGYLADKFNISLSELSMINIQSHLQAKNVEQQQIEEVIQILESCEFARYAPKQLLHNRQDLYNSSIHIISNIEKSLK